MHVKFGTTVLVVAVPTYFCTTTSLNTPYIMDVMNRLHTVSFPKPIPVHQEHQDKCVHTPAKIYRFTIQQMQRTAFADSLFA